MKGAWVVALGVLVGGCNWWPVGKATPGAPTAAKAMIDSSGWVPTGNDDLDTVAICLLDFMKQGRMTNLVDGQRSTIVINKLTNGPSDYISEAQIASETRRMNVSPDIVASLQAKNSEAHEVTWIPSGLPFFVSDLSTLPENLA